MRLTRAILATAFLFAFAIGCSNPIEGFALPAATAPAGATAPEASPSPLGRACSLLSADELRTTVAGEAGSLDSTESAPVGEAATIVHECRYVRRATSSPVASLAITATKGDFPDAALTNVENRCVNAPITMADVSNIAMYCTYPDQVIAVATAKSSHGETRVAVLALNHALGDLEPQQLSSLGRLVANRI
ncbi:MAG TPA: hypothetical protein VJX66_21445 [Amycolatopsis sp.]|nr:hypothetical protein [Amycolatopsis sp.]